MTLTRNRLMGISAALILLAACSPYTSSQQAVVRSVTATTNTTSTPKLPALTPTPTVIPTAVPTTAPSPTPLPAFPTPTAQPAVTVTPETRPPGQTVDLPDVDAHYFLDIANLDLTGGTLDVDERVEITSHQRSIPRLFFTVATAEWGYFTLDSASIDGTVVVPTSLNDGFTLAVDPPPGDHWIVEIVYHLALSQVPRDWYGTGLDGNIVRLGYWFPMLSTNFRYPSTADPAYSRVSSFDVSLPLPDNTPFVSTGVEVAQKAIDANYTRHHLHADNVRDFAMVIAPGDRIDKTETANGVTIQLMSDPASGSAARTTQLVAAKKVIETLSRLIGPYPYPVFSMADAGPSLPGGIEFPMLIYLNPAITPLDRLVYHETAHQWLYGIIGTRPQQDIWIDEGGAQFLEGFLDTGSSVPDAPPGGYPYPLDSSDSELPQGAGIPGYQSIYLQGQRFYQTVLTQMGSDAFWNAMQAIYQQHKFGIVTPWDMLLSWQTHSSVDLRPLFHSIFRYDWIDQLPAPGI